jgi:hypothetical protein
VKDYMQAVLDQNFIAKAIINKNTTVFGDKIGVVAQLFGCWHKELSRPFMHGKQGYRACLNCGARKQFDTDSLETKGPFYYPPTVS